MRPGLFLLKFFGVLATFVSLSLSETFAWTIDQVKGGVVVTSKGQKAAASEKMVLKAGDIIETGNDGLIHLRDGESEIWIGSASRFTVHKLSDPETDEIGRLDLNSGRLRARFKRPLGPQAFPYEVKTKSLLVSVRGTEFIVSSEGVDEQVRTIEGLVRVSSVKTAAESWDVPAGRGLFAKPNEMPKVRDVSPEQLKKWIDSTSGSF